MAKSASRQVTVFLNGSQVEGNIKAISGAFKQAQNELNRMTVGSDEYIAKLEEVKKLKAPLDEHNKQLRGIKGGLDQAKGGMEKFVGVAAGAFAVEEIIGYGKALFNMGVQMEASGRKAQVVFGEALPRVTQEAERNAAAMGLTNAQYIAAAANIQDLLVPMGFQRDEAANISTQLVNLSGALSEWSGGQLDAKEVSMVLNDALLGERESLKQLGISISQADVDAALLAKGLNNLTGAAKQQAEATVTLDLILAKSQDAQTAYADNTGNMARQSAEMTAKFTEVAEKLSTLLIPVFNKLLSVVNLVADGLGFLIDPTSALIEENKSLADSVRDTQTEFNLEIAVLKEGNFTQEEKAKLIGEINTKYGEYLPNLLSEKASIDEITKAQKAANQAFSEKILYLSLQDEITRITKEATAATKAALEAERGRVKASQENIVDNGQFAEALQQRQELFQGLRELNQDIIKDAPTQIEKITAEYDKLAESLGTTIAKIKAKFAQKDDGGGGGGTGGKENNADIQALKEEAEWRKINADMIRQKPIIQAEVGGLIAEQQAVINEQNRQKSLEALNLQLQDYIEHKAQTKLVDLNYEEEKAAALETIRVDLLTEREREIEELSQHYAGLLALAERYGIDVKKLKEKFEKEIKEIEDKYRDQKEKAEQEAQDKKLDAINKNLTAYGQLIQAGFDFIEDESSRSIDFQKVAALAQIAIDTAKAISSLTAASAANPSNSFTFGAAGAAQFVSGLAQILANVAAAKKVLFGAPKVTQKYEGGYMVTGATDGRSYNPAMIAPPSTGMLPGHPVLFQSRATGQPVLASERGPEYFVSTESLRDPYVANMVRMIDLASNGRRVSQFADGGVNPPTAAQTTTESSRVLGDLATALTILNRILGSGINAVLPDDTIVNAKKRFDKINDNTGGYYG